MLYNKQDAVIIVSLVIATIGNIEAADVQQISPNLLLPLYASTTFILLLKVLQFHFRLKVPTRNQLGETELLSESR